MPAVSVIVPNYNHSAFLHQRINSILQQTYQDFELILLDDCSSDSSREILNKYRGHEKVSHVVFNEKNAGNPFRQWQKGLGLATGEYAWIAESDDWAEPEFLELLMEKIAENQNVGICFCGSNWVDEQGRPGKDLSIYHSGFSRDGVEEIRLSLLKFCTIQNASSMLIKKQLAQKYIGRVVDYSTCGDWHLYIDVLQESNLVYLDNKLNNFRWYHDNLSNAAAKNGTWITEGLKAIVYSDAYKLDFSKAELEEIFNYWILKTREFKSIKRLHLHLLTFFYFLIFRGKRMFYSAR